VYDWPRSTSAVSVVRPMAGWRLRLSPVSQAFCAPMMRSSATVVSQVSGVLW
jgi:hypothetical protein